MQKAITILLIILYYYTGVFSQDMLNPDSLQKEIRTIQQLIEDIHPNPYLQLTKKKFNKEMEDAISRVKEPMNRLEYCRIAIPLVAKLQDGHTRLELPNEEREKFINEGGKFLPLQLDIVNEKILVLQNMSDFPEIQKNWEILSINGKKAQNIIKECRSFRSSEVTAHKDWVTAAYFNKMFWFLYGANDHFDVILKNNNAQIKKLILDGITRDEILKRNEDQEPPFEFDILGDGLGYMNIPTFASPMDTFLDSIFTNTIPFNSINNLIIDIRENGGGDSRNVVELISYITSKPINLTEYVDYKISNYMRSQNWFAEFYNNVKEFDNNGMLSFPPDSVMPKSTPFKGNIYLLISHKTYSGAVWLASAIKCHNLGILIGEETGGMTTSPGDTWALTLSYSKLTLSISPKIFALCCSSGLNQRVSPHYSIPYSISKGESKDPSLNKVVELIKGGN